MTLIKEITTIEAIAQATAMLAPYLTENRKQLIETLLPQRISSVHVAVESPADPHNAAAIVRSCEALGAMSIHVIAAEDKALHAKGTTQGAFHWVNTYHHSCLSDFNKALKKNKNNEGIVVAAAAMDGELSLDQLSIDQPICLLFGNEKRGLSKQAHELSDVSYHIPMFGVSQSLNLSVSAAISLYETLQRKRQALGKSGDCSDEQQQQLRLQYYAHSLDQRLVKSLLTPIKKP